MLKHLTVKQHLDKAEEQWLMVANEGISKQEALRRMGSDRPLNTCYLCEIFHDDYQPDNGCNLCPLNVHADACEGDDEPYGIYKKGVKGGWINTDAAMDIVELIRTGRKKLNY